MKKIILPLLLLSYSLIVNAQNTFPSSGNAGIGTTTPSKELEVKGTIKTDTLLFPDGTKQLTAFPNKFHFLKVGDSSTVVTQHGILRDDGDLRIQTADTIVNNFSPPSTSIFSPNNFNTVINVGNTGKVGIGTFSPTEKLTVAGTIYSTTGGFKFPDGTLQTTAGVQQNSSAAFSSLAVSNLSGVGDRQVLVDASGNLKNGNPIPQFFCGDPWCTNGNLTTDPNVNFLGTKDNVDLVIRTNSIERLRVKTNGRIGIGTNNPQTTLHILGIDPAQCPVGLRLEYLYTGSVFNGCTTSSVWDIKNSGNGTLDFSTSAVGIPIITIHPTGINVNGTIKATGKVLASAYASNSPLIFEAPVGTERARIDDVTGNVGIGTSTPSQQLHIAGASPAIFFEDNFIQTGTAELANFTISADNGAGRLISDKSVGVFINGDNNQTDQEFAVFHNNTSYNPPYTKLFSVNENGNAFLFGELHACKVVVEVLSGCDFVLEENYNLMPLKIRKEKVLFQKHLLNIKPAAEMETKGADLGGTTMGILQNVEEHEKYLYNHDERIEKLEKEKDEQKALIDKLIKELDELKKTQNKK